MLFNSYIFVLVFLPVCVFLYYGLNYLNRYTLAQISLLAMSLWFYGYFNAGYLIIIIFSVLVNYSVYFLLSRISDKRPRKVILICGLFFNTGLLVYFKYMDFFVDNINVIFRKEYALPGIFLPLGISFFTFQQISFIVDAYKGEMSSVRYHFLHYASFVTFFPQLIAGPIVTHDELIPQFLDKARKKINWDNMARGIYIFILGMSKKVLLADTFGNAVNWGYGNLAGLNSTDAWIIMLAYTFQIYFDFSGYCDMAVGIGKILNIDLPVNFNSPYKAFTITEFWDRWHITLTRFFTKYIYLPLGGNRKGTIRTYLNIMLVFLVSGFWHGASWNFVFWGACHGLFSIITRRFRKNFVHMHPVLSWLITFLFINVMWVFFRADTFGDAVMLLQKVLVCRFGEINTEILSCFKLPETEFFLQSLSVEAIYPCFMLNVFLTIALIMILGCKNAYERMEAFKPSVSRVLWSAFMLVWCVFSFSGVSTFLYYNF